MDKSKMIADIERMLKKISDKSLIMKIYNIVLHIYNRQ